MGSRVEFVRIYYQHRAPRVLEGFCTSWLEAIHLIAVITALLLISIQIDVTSALGAAPETDVFRVLATTNRHHLASSRALHSSPM